MIRASSIQAELGQIGTIQELTGVFESIASTRIAKIKTKVEVSTAFFGELWELYTALRVDPKSRITHRELGNRSGNQKVYVMITAEGGLSGDIDQRLIESVLADYDPSTTDLMVLGDHGAGQLSQRRIKYVNYFRVPESEDYIDVGPIVAAITDYAQITVYYEAYVSLGVQEIKKIDLISAVRVLSQEAGSDELIISDLETVFEPSVEEIADRMEQSMIGLALNQVILESSLAQDASRFNAMVVAKKRAGELYSDMRLDYYRARRSERDRRQREVMVSLKKKGRG